MKNLISLVSYFRKFKVLQIFTIYLRYLIGGAFVMAAVGMGKLSSTPIPLALAANKPIQELEPIQLFFRVMAESGLYWNFIGWSQIIAGGLLMTQRFASLGAAMFFGIILNIFVITVSYGFTGTPIVTGLMLLAVCFLLLWDIEKWQFLFLPYSIENLTAPQTLQIIGNTFWEILGLALFILIFSLYALGFDLLIQMASCLVLGLIGFVLYFLLQRRN
ncbi:hypothetical protein [Shivajiella indica]|uniref:Uncharacterized protein n=1 Tax=Shivajiella indica TaxID=872115 RepID=A0ABW5BC46_9BACT